MVSGLGFMVSGLGFTVPAIRIREEVAYSSVRQVSDLRFGV